MQPANEDPQVDAQRWKFLEKRPRSVHQQLYVIGKPFKAFDVYEEIIATDESYEEASNAWNLPIEAIHEIVEYCKQNQKLLKQESHDANRRLESIYRISSSARRILRLLLYGILALLPIILLSASRDWILYTISVLIFILFLRFVKQLPIIGEFWISCFGDNSVFEWLKVTVIPVSVLFLGASITSAINSRQSEANVETSRYGITQRYLDLFLPNNESAGLIEQLKKQIVDPRPKGEKNAIASTPLLHIKANYAFPSRCFAFPQSAWLSNQTQLAFSQLSGLKTNSHSRTRQKRYILDLIHKVGLIKVGKNVITLREADLSDSDLILLDLRDSCLESVNFSDYAGTPGNRSDLRHAKLDNSDLSGSNLKNANMRSTSLQGVELRGYASLQNSDLRGADLSNARIDNSTVLKGSIINTSFLDVKSHKQSWLYEKLCYSPLRRYLRATYYCLDNIDYKDLYPTKLPNICTSTGCKKMTLDEIKAKGAIVENNLPVQ
jgi:uncharacterized protein YjbI with pentapeptide repeats